MTIKLKIPHRKVNEKMTPEALHRAAETYREMYDKVVANNILLKKQLAIAVEALKDIIKEDMYNLDEHRAFIEEKLKMIKELEK